MPVTSTPDKPSNWHSGEQLLHREIGKTEWMEKLGEKVIRPHMPEQHRTFFNQLTFLVCTFIDETGALCPLILTGEPGFITAPSSTQLEIRPASLPQDIENQCIIEPSLKPGSKVSILGIDYGTRRRNRMNGTIITSDSDHLQISVDQSFGNCPKYIHTKQNETISQTKGTQYPQLLSQDDPRIAVFLAQADSVFLATRADQLGSDPRAGLDINHRGGLPGFIAIRDDQSVVIPDYRGNNFFNAFGNLRLDARCSLLVPDFKLGQTLTLQAHGRVTMDDPDGERRFGSRRYVTLRISRSVLNQSALPFRLDLVSPATEPPLDGSINANNPNIKSN